jgi:hypothetical protein
VLLVQFSPQGATSQAKKRLLNHYFLSTQYVVVQKLVGHHMMYVLEQEIFTIAADGLSCARPGLESDIGAETRVLEAGVPARLLWPTVKALGHRLDS